MARFDIILNLKSIKSVKNHITSLLFRSFQPMTGFSDNIRYVQDLPLTPRHWYLVLVSSMEQLIGTALSTIVGIIIPMLNLFLNPDLSSAVQGIMGAIGLIGIALGSAIIGPLSDRTGYIVWFRACAVLIVIGSVVTSIIPCPVTMCCGLFISGFGIGGGYTLDSAYISELMPDKWRNFMVGVAKATCAIGCVLPALIAVIILHHDPNPHAWRSIVWIMGGLGIITLLMRIHWAESPGWLTSKGRLADAERASRFFFGKDVEYEANQQKTPQVKSNGILSLFKGKNLLRVIYSGIPWACEGLGVYGIGVFLPLLIMALGIDNSVSEGMAKVVNSVEMTAIINFCIIPGFIIGLSVVNRISHSLMLWGGFIGSAAGMALLLIAYLLHWPVWVSVVSFMIFEILLNGGPHLITYIIPAAIYPVEDRGAGSGVADFLGKLGAIIGVFFMPMWLKAGGITLVLYITIGVMLAGALTAIIFSRLLKLN